MVTGAFAKLVSRDYEKYFWDEYKRAPVEYTKVFHLDPISGSYEKEAEAAGLTKFLEMGEGEAIPFENFKQGNEKEFNPKNFGLATQITRNMYEDDQSRIMRKAHSELGYAALAAQETEAWDMLNTGTSATTRAGFDSLALFSGSHATIKGGGTIDNEATSGALSVSTLQAMYNHFEKMVNEVNQPAPMKAWMLIIPPELKWQAKTLMLSEYDPEDSNMRYNTVANEGLQYMVCHWLTSTTAWFVLAKNHDLRFRWRRPVKYESMDDFNTGNVLVKGTSRFVADFANFRGAYYNAGT
jgi:phage major head subunit gpT-like protein